MARVSFSPDHDACGVGFIAQLGGGCQREIVQRGLEALRRLAHRGGVDADGRSGDGAGLLIQIPEKFMRARARCNGIELPDVFAVGMVFLPVGQEDAARIVIEASVAAHKLEFLGWRKVPTDAAILGPRSLHSLPSVEQCFIGAPDGFTELERTLFRLRKEVEYHGPAGTYFCSLSSRTVVYKGLLTPEQLNAFYLDLGDPDFASSFVIFHQRYSTNTRPSWALAQPFRFVAHNGEINTITANRRWLRAKKHLWQQRLGLDSDVRLLEPGASDSGSFDNAFELYLRRGYSPEAAMLCMVPPAWENEQPVHPEVRSLLHCHATEQEPWDGPAALIFSDGNTVGAKLDRNGLRPLRYTLSSDGLLIAGSEVGIADLHGKRIIERQRLGPGEMLTVVPRTGAILRPGQCPDVRKWCWATLPRTLLAADISPSVPTRAQSSPISTAVLASLGWSEDQYRLLFQPLVESGQEAVWSMGDDAAPAFLSELPRSLWDYCKQRFAQVTNPPIDPMREAHVMSMTVCLGDNTLLPSPVLDAAHLLALRKKMEQVEEIDLTFDIAQGMAGALASWERIQRNAEMLSSEVGLVLLTDRAVDKRRAALPVLLAAAAIWQAMTRAGLWRVPLIVESGQVIETHHIALLIAVGATAVVAYAALNQAETLHAKGEERYRAAVEKGLRKVLARMGISTLASYRNSQLFETLGLDSELRTEFFEDAGGVLGGKRVIDLLQDCLDRHTLAFASERSRLPDLGLYRFRHAGESHASSPQLVRRMHGYLKSPTAENYRFYTELADQRKPLAIRDQLEISPGSCIPLHEVESQASVLSRFSTQAMSLGAISPETHKTLAIAMNRLGARSNTGEGGEDPSVYAENGHATHRIKQVASARFGVTAEYLVQADELEIKIAQGAKPGEGGQLPASKVTALIARLRHAMPNMTLISPPPHHDIYSIEDLAQLIHDLRCINSQARIGVKLVSSSGVGIIACGVVKAGADVITISGHDGGTGASPLTSIKNTGMPWEIGLRDAHRALVGAGLRGRVRLRADGGFKFARDVIIAALLGADEFGFGTAALLALGCVMARQCHLNTCPVGIATQNEELRARFSASPEMLETYFRGIAGEIRELLALMGARSINDIVGAAQRLRQRGAASDCEGLAELLAPTADTEQVAYPRAAQSALETALNRHVGTFETLGVRSHRFPITNADLSIGTRLSGEIVRQQINLVSPIECEFTGTAGQSFGAFLVRGVNLKLLGEANDYVGKGLCGGRIAISAGEDASRRGDVLAGNTALYGATAGELYISGRAGERFAVRNSGALAVAEGTGQHACEYMTAGVVVIMGPAGANLGAGMTGGLAYVLRDQIYDRDYNQESVRVIFMAAREELWLRRVLRRHVVLTGSPVAVRLLASRASLPFLRLQPVHLPCPIEETWGPILKHLRPTCDAFSGSDLGYRPISTYEQ
ncbi:MAG TPA: glutamate synthase large subunit [Terriglobales bacterium]|nr:glutamate synthase large subunit [Terriglobales bacterium]